MIRMGLWGPLYFSYNYYWEPLKEHGQFNYQNYEGPYIIHSLAKGSSVVACAQQQNMMLESQQFFSPAEAWIGQRGRSQAKTTTQTLHPEP